MTTFDLDELASLKDIVRFDQEDSQLNITCKWVIQSFPTSFSEIVVNKKDSHLSRSFSIEDKVKWNLQLRYEQIENTEEKSSLSLRIIFEDECEFMSWEAFVLNRKGYTEPFSASSSSEEKNVLHFSNIADKIDELLLLNDSMTIICYVKVKTNGKGLKLDTSSLEPTITEVKTVDMGTQTVQNENEVKDAVKLRFWKAQCQQLKKLFNDQTFADIMFRIKGKVLYAHKVILSTRISNFSPLNEHLQKYAIGYNSRGEIIDVIEIDDIPYDVMKKALKFIYTGELKLENFCGKVDPLLKVADRYGIRDLRNRVEDCVIQNFYFQIDKGIHHVFPFKGSSLDNFVVTLLYASHHNLDRLKCVAVNEIKKNSKLYQQSDFDAISKVEPNLLTHILSENLHLHENEDGINKKEYLNGTTGAPKNFFNDQKIKDFFKKHAMFDDDDFSEVLTTNNSDDFK